MATVGKITKKGSPKKVYQQDYVWVIENYRDIGTDGILSPPFFMGDDAEFEYYLAAYFQHFGSVIALVPLKKSLPNVDRWNFQISITDKTGQQHSMDACSQIKDGTFYPATCFIFGKMNQQLFDDTSKLLPGSEVRITCTANVLDISTTDTKMCKFHEDDLKVCEKVFDAEKYSDFMLVVEDKKFKVHRAILAARSPVFEAMFDSNMCESTEGKVDIVDVEPKVMEKLLRFIYLNELKNAEDLADKLLIAAEKYQINELKQSCEDILANQLSLTNVYDILQLADKHTAEHLKKKTLEFFHRNAKSLAGRQDFKTCMNSLPGDLKTDIIRVLIDMD